MKDKDSWEIKITDFGLSRLLEYDQEMLTTMCGTPLFLAPEVLSSKKRGGYGFEVDYWSIGVILYLMLVGHPPYNEKEGPLLELVKKGQFSFPAQTWSTVTPQAKDLVSRLMCIDVDKRYNGKQTLAHPWMRINGNDNNHNHNHNHMNDNTDNMNGRSRVRKRKEMDDSETKETEEDDKRPPMKRYKNANGDAINTNQMSMDSFASNNLTPFDSLVGIMEPKRNENKNKNNNNNNKNKNRGIANLKLDNNENHNNFGSNNNINGNQPNGNGASLKEMSLDD